MAYIGNKIPANFQSLPAVQRFNGDGSDTTFTLSAQIANDQSILVSVDGVTQDSNAYAVSGTTLTFTAAPSAGTGNIFVNTISPVGSTVVPPDGSVTNAKVASGIASSKLTGALPAISGAALTGFTSSQMPAGSVLQVVQGTFSTQTDSTNNGAVATGLTVNITPGYSNSKILASYSLPLRNGVSNNNYIFAYLYRDGSSIGTTSILKVDSSAINAHVTAEILDAPATTSQVTYAAYVNPRGHTTQWCGASVLATITVMEVAG